MELQRKAIAEVLGTLWLVLGGCGSAVLAGIFFSPFEDGTVSTGIGFPGVSVAFGLTVLTAAYALGTSPAVISTRRSPSACWSPGASRCARRSRTSSPR